MEVRHVLGQYGLKLVPVEEQHPIQQLAADPSLGDCVRPGSRTGVRGIWMASLANTASKTLVNVVGAENPSVCCDLRLRKPC